MYCSQKSTIEKLFHGTISNMKVFMKIINLKDKGESTDFTNSDYNLKLKGLPSNR